MKIHNIYHDQTENQVVLDMGEGSVREIQIEQPVYVQLAKDIKRTSYLNGLKSTMHIGGKLTKETILEIVEIVKIDGFSQIVSHSKNRKVKLEEALEECESLGLPLHFMSVFDYVVPLKSIAILITIPGISVRSRSIIPWSIGGTRTIIVDKGQQAVGTCIDDEAYVTSGTLETAIADNTLEKLRSDMQQIDRGANPLIIITSAREQIAEMANS